jgi:hypothetical protein
MVFSLQKPFLIFLLLPVSLIFVVTGVALFFYARAHLLDQWEIAARLRLERMAHEIRMRLDDKRDVIELIVNAENTPDRFSVQAYLATQLARQEAASFVDIANVSTGEARSPQHSRNGFTTAESNSREFVVQGGDAAKTGGLWDHQRMMNQGLSDRVIVGRGTMTGYRGMSMSLDDTVNFLSIVKSFGGTDENPARRITVLVSLNSAVTCALEMQRALDEVSKHNEAGGLPSLEMGIGIHTGEVVVGNIGSETRAKYGIVGTAVNETHRIQSLAQGHEVPISEHTYCLVADRIDVGPSTQAHLKGFDGLRDLYPVTSIRREDTCAL